MVEAFGVAGCAERGVAMDGFGILWWLRLPFAPPLNFVFGGKVLKIPLCDREVLPIL